MTQPEQAVGGEDNVPVTAEDPFEALAEEFLGPDEVEDEEQVEEAEQGEDPENAEDVAEDATKDPEEDQLPPIPAPTSWDAEAKERFAKLPREDQEYLAKREGERERFVQAKSQEAAQAQRNASIEAMKQVERLQAEYAEHLQTYAKQFEVQPPDPDLITTNPAAYAQQLKIYQHAQAQRSQAQQDVERVRAEQAQIQQARAAHEAEAFHQRLQAEVPEVFDPATGQEVLKQLTATAELLGFDPNEISDVTAIKALKATSEWKTKADKYDALMKKQMERVRTGKNPPPIAKPGTAKTPNETKGRRADAAWQAALEGSRSGNRNLRDQGFTAWAEASGIFD